MDAMTHTIRNIFASALFAGMLVPDAGAQVSYLERISCPQDPVRIVTDEPGRGGRERSRPSSASHLTGMAAE